MQTNSKTGATLCSDCGPGKASPELPRNSSRKKSCTVCPAGTFSGTRAGSCEECDFGTFQANAESASCDACDAGRSTMGFMGAKNCSDCPMGYFSTTRAKFCEQCSKGFFADKEGKSQCEACE